MAHHVAELIYAAKCERSPAKRKKAELRAIETILKIWEHRESLPSYAYPLARYDELFKILDRLQPSDNPFQNYRNDTRTEVDRLAAVLFDRLSRLIVALLLIKPGVLGTERVEDSAIDALDNQERQVWNAIQKWGELFIPPTDSKRRTEKGAARGKTPEIDLNQVALQLTSEVQNATEELRMELAEAKEGDGKISPYGRNQRRRNRKLRPKSK
jgi:hypothetical protein